VFAGVVEIIGFFGTTTFMKTLLPRLGDRGLNWQKIFLDGCRGFRFKNRMNREISSEPSKEDLLALIVALRAENASLKARLAELERLLGFDRSKSREPRSR
jgi:hypothetical protein